MDVFDGATLGGVLLSVFALWRTFRIGRRLRRYNDRLGFNEARSTHKAKLMGLLLALQSSDGAVTDERVVSLLAAEVESGVRSYGSVLPLWYRWAFRALSMYLARPLARMTTQGLRRRVARCAAVYDRREEELF